MAAIACVQASLRVMGDGLEPEEVSALLGRGPTRSHRRGEPVDSGGRKVVQPTGAWILESPLPETAEFEDHVEALLASLTSDADEWMSLTERFSASISCRGRLGGPLGTFELSPRIAAALAERGLVIAFDIQAAEAGERGVSAERVSRGFGEGA